MENLKSIGSTNKDNILNYMQEYSDTPMIIQETRNIMK